MKCDTCGAEIEEVEVETPLGRRRGLRVVQFIGAYLCDRCQSKLKAS
jgi:DNA-directed RNA polymerase subunit RPC12/RpoP